jgi:hypothetical protein
MVIPPKNLFSKSGGQRPPLFSVGKMQASFKKSFLMI